MSPVFAALQYLIRALVDAPEKIAIERIETPKADIFNISVPQEEMGRLVGRSGRTAEAIRDVLGAIGARLGKEVIIDVIEARPTPPRAAAKRSRRRARSKTRSAHHAH
ncbi:MAG: KH domain-containing protein [Candidatus Bipolaricaulota bacterium]|nr:KH domain-containing protein [Candidatus Bipolaricaulota bacterium]MDW8031865.1 KH domain-containing protein [Candidatus Bipolaricaulota bacterium]